MARILTSRIETSGQRFLQRRIDQAITQRDSRMFHAPMNVQAAATSVGLILAALWIGIGLFLAWLKPQTTITNNKIGQLDGTIYVLIAGKLHEVYNLASARLIQGNSDIAVSLKATELQAYPRGLPLGIIDAPTSLQQVTTHDSHFTVCYTRPLDDSAILRPVGTTVIIGDLTQSHKLSADEAILVKDPIVSHHRSWRAGDRRQKFWLLYRGHRSRINIQDRGLVSALGINHEVLDNVTAISPALFNAIPQTDPMILPRIFHKGEVAPYAPRYRIGQIGRVKSALGTNYYLILINGLAKISPLIESIRQNYAMSDPFVEMTAHDATILPSAEYDAGQFPSQAPEFRQSDTICEAWQYQQHTALITKELYAQASLPLSDEQISELISFRTVHSNNYAKADHVFIAPGTGWYVMATNNEAGPINRTESLFFISDTGICYGIPSYEFSSVGRLVHVADVLGFKESVPAPAQIIDLLPQGSMLSPENALIEHAYISVDKSQVLVHK